MSRLLLPIAVHGTGRIRRCQGIQCSPPEPTKGAILNASFLPMPNPASHAEWNTDSRSVLAHAHALRSAGLHEEAIRWLKDAMRTDLRRDEVFAGMALALKARSQLHLLDDAGAMLTISLVPPIVRQFNPKVDAYCQLVTGLVHRRRAYRSWKAGSHEPQMLQTAIECFAQAQQAAESAMEERLASIAELNQLYARGLEAAIAGLSQQVNPGLIIAAIHAEALAIAKTPVEEAASIAGLIVIADLAIGGELEPQDVLGLSDAIAFRLACMKIFAGKPASWPEELLRAAMKSGIALEQKVRALILGSRQLAKAGLAMNPDLVRSYLLHLTECDYSIWPTRGTDHSPSRVSEQIALLARLSNQEVPRRKVFR